MRRQNALLGAAVSGLLWWVGCSSDDTDGAHATSPDDGDVVERTELPEDFFEATRAPFTMQDDAARTIQVSASGEALGAQGYDYTSTPGDGDLVFVDGWQVRFTRYLVTIGKVSVAAMGADPDKRDQVGSTVVEQRGPWIVDVHKPGPIVGAGGSPETAVPVVVLRANFDTARTYAFSYETTPATFSVKNTNLVAADRAALLAMIEHGWVKYIEGTATYRGRTSSASVDSSFEDYPTRVHFAFGIADPAAYLNCHNPEIGEADEPTNRGVRPSGAGAVRAQLTFHTDHLFWDQADVEGAPLRFDALAARVLRFGEDTGALHELTSEELAGVSPSALVDQNEQPVRDRGEQTQGYEPGAVRPPTYGTNGVSDITDLRSFIAYNNRAQGHLNSDGLCFVQPSAELSF